MLGNLPSRKNPWNSVWQAPLNTELKTTSGHRILVLWRENRQVELGEDAPDNQTTIRSWTAFLRKDEYSEIGYCKLVQSNICGSFSFIDSHPKKKFIDHSFTTKNDCLFIKWSLFAKKEEKILKGTLEVVQRSSWRLLPKVGFQLATPGSRRPPLAGRTANIL